MPRRSARSISIDSNVRCTRIYPTDETQKTVEDLETIGIRLSREQAVHLARVVLAATQEWAVIDITGYRRERRASDGTYRLTITSQQAD